jgi:uncharacterized protein YndB with AHSA1/START domain
VSKPQFVYTVYINAAPDAVWRGIVEPEFTRRYWMHDNVSDWQVGSRWQHVQVEPPTGKAPWPVEPGKVDITGEVVESDRPRRLVLTWAKPEREGDPSHTSRVTFALEPLDWPMGPWTRLTLTHDDLTDDEMRESVSFGWPAVMSVMKTLVERS